MIIAMGLPAKLADQLTEREAKFVALLTKGQNEHEAALGAGYPAASVAVETHRLLRRPCVLAAIQFETRRELVPLGMLSVRGLRTIITDDTDKSAAGKRVRLEAIKTALDRAGHVAPRATIDRTAGELPLHEMSVAELRALASTLETEIQTRAKDVSRTIETPTQGQVIDLLG